MSLIARLEVALATIEKRRVTDAASALADKSRLERIELAAAEAVRALDALIGQD